MEILDSISRPQVWKNLVSKYQKSQTWKSVWQLCNSFIPFVLIWILMLFALDYSYWITLLLALPASGFTVRLFIIQHDCGHGSFFSSRRANDLSGLFCSIFTLTPYYYWRKKHAIHHASAGNLEQRGIGDVYTMTVNEYKRQTKWGKLKYRLYRNPLILFIFSPVILFTIIYRFPTPRLKALKNYRSSVYITDIAIAVLTVVLVWLVGLKEFLLVQGPITVITSSTGAWLFFVQHQFEDTYWAEKENWNYALAALSGSSYYKLPKILQWFTGNIGFHHIHHLSPRIPNYMLEKCHKENPEFQKTAKVLTFSSGFKSILLTLWDEKQKKLVSFGQMKRLYPKIDKALDLQH